MAFVHRKQMQPPAPGAFFPDQKESCAPGRGISDMP